MFSEHIQNEDAFWAQSVWSNMYVSQFVACPYPIQNSCPQNWLWGPPSLVKVSIQFHQVQKLRMYGALPPLRYMPSCVKT